ncbi:ABC transporter ATP-binding protein [Vallitalea pronyensis]|uniref:ABC-type quaternary amine transporter n=2 Tax=Vallitalea pronyensis TaxID=1348613 RepID=A0A8J8MQD5_9FIRM|nr:ABC transporter ATP-binding protein [Vallitalea pronyensis]QUI25671.1 ABC transporter ATP-binding protein [Vallitalea pronyensis]
MSIVMKAIFFKYRNAKEDVLKGVSITMEQGDIIAILGDSGSGKSTILRLIAGLEMPYKGSITINNRVIVNERTFIPPEKREVGMVFQDYALFPHMTVEKNVQFGLGKMSRKEKTYKVNTVLGLVGLDHYGKRYPHELSGGQQQRVALARALAPMPNLLLLDEPFSNLDAGLKEGIRNQLKAIFKKTNLTSIFVTHDREDALAIADKVILLSDGKVIKSGIPNSVIY